MDWLKDLIGQKKEIPVKRASVTKKTSTDRRFHVRNSDQRILIAHKSPSGNGYIYKSKGPNGVIRNVHINGNLYKTEEEAQKKVARLKKQNKG